MFRQILFIVKCIICLENCIKPVQSYKFWSENLCNYHHGLEREHCLSPRSQSFSFPRRKRCPNNYESDFCCYFYSFATIYASLEIVSAHLLTFCKCNPPACILVFYFFFNHCCSILFYFHGFLVSFYWITSSFDLGFHCGAGALRVLARELGCRGQGKGMLHEGSSSHWFQMLLKDQGAE